MTLPVIPIPKNDNSKAAQFLRKLDAQAKAEGKSGWAELMAEQSPDMADILSRMLKAELAARKAGRKKPGCTLCEANSTTS